MNRQVLNRVLIVVLVIVWSFVGYKFISNFFSKKEILIADSFKIEPVKTSPIQRDTFRLKESNRDPFLNTYKKTERAAALSRTGGTKRIEKRETPWPKIEYFGFVKNENSKSPLVLLKINNRIKRMRQGETTDNIIVKNIYNDSILILKGKEKKIFKRGNQY